ncbi:unnamed protein product [Caretta caretta]
MAGRASIQTGVIKMTSTLHFKGYLKVVCNQSTLSPSERQPPWNGGQMCTGTLYARRRRRTYWPVGLI